MTHDDIRSVGGSENGDVLERLDAIQLGQQLVQHAIAHAITVFATTRYLVSKGAMLHTAHIQREREQDSKTARSRAKREKAREKEKN
jgi:hypothetical protein